MAKKEDNLALIEAKEDESIVHKESDQRNTTERQKTFGNHRYKETGEKLTTLLDKAANFIPGYKDKLLAEHLNLNKSVLANMKAGKRRLRPEISREIVNFLKSKDSVNFASIDNSTLLGTYSQTNENEIDSVTSLVRLSKKYNTGKDLERLRNIPDTPIDQNNTDPEEVIDKLELLYEAVGLINKLGKHLNIEIIDTGNLMRITKEITNKQCSLK